MLKNKSNILLNILKYGASFAFAFTILYFLFRNQDPIKLIEEIRKVDSKWVALSMIFGAWAYVIRGLRWTVLVDALGYKSSKLNSIASVSIGYFTNLFIPRAGEISRCTALYRVEKIPVNKLFGTILIERVIDFGFLFGLIFITILLKFPAISKFYITLQAQQLTRNLDRTDFLLLLGGIIGVLVAFYLLKIGVKKSKFYEKTSSFIDGLKEGFRSIKKMKNKSIFWAHTFSIWIMYFLMTYICFFSMYETSHLGISDGLFLLIIGGIGMIIPTPGGIGSYHAIVMIGLVVLGVGFIDLRSQSADYNPALVFPTIVHVAQTLVAIIMGSGALIILFLSKKNPNESS